MGYSLCKILNLGKNLNCLKHVKIDSASLLEIFCAKKAGKNIKYSRNKTILKIGHLAKAIAFAWAISFVKCSIWAKNLKSLKHAKIDSASILEIFCVKKPSKKHQIFQR